MARAQTVHGWLAGEGAQRDFVSWAEPFGGDVARLWESCPRGDWLLALASRLGAPTASLVAAACECARRAVAQVPGERANVDACLTGIRSWADGARAPLDVAELERMRRLLEAARDAAQDAAEAEAMLAAVAALETVSDPALAASAAAFAAHATLVSAADCAMEQALRFAQQETAEAVRAIVPTDTIATLWSQRQP